MKRLYIIICLFLTSISLVGCIKEETKIVDHKQFEILSILLNNPTFSDEELFYNLIYQNIDQNLTLRTYSTTAYIVHFSNELAKYNCLVNSNIITKTDVLTKEESIFSDNIEITSLDLFSTLILDSYSDEFLYYNSKSLIPLALELMEKEELSFTFENDKFNYITYKLEANINKLNLDDDFHNALLLSSSAYKDLYSQEDLKIRIVFNTDLNSKYLLSTMDFYINDIEIATIK